MGLPSSGKTTLAKELYKALPDCDWFNADEVRKQCDDWDFSEEGRLRQAVRMDMLASESKAKYVICDFVAPTGQIRAIFKADLVIWLDTIDDCKYEDTNLVFQKPIAYDYRIKTKDATKWAKTIIKEVI